MDVHNKEIRSYNMSKIKGKDTKPEDLVRKHLFRNGFRYYKNYKGLPGTPDIVLKRYKTAIFINGCFWHKHEGCKYFTWPKSNVEFWRNKIYSNIVRDNRNYEELKELGWNVIIIWECELKKPALNSTLSDLINCLKIYESFK